MKYLLALTDADSLVIIPLDEKNVEVMKNVVINENFVFDAETNEEAQVKAITLLKHFLEKQRKLDDA